MINICNDSLQLIVECIYIYYFYKAININKENSVIDIIFMLLYVYTILEVLVCYDILYKTINK